MGIGKVTNINSIEGLNPASRLKKEKPSQVEGLGFGDILSQAKERIKKSSDAETISGVKFSNHAVERMQSRGITFSKQDLSRLTEALEKASSKGSKNSLILMNDSAIVASVKNKTVVTVMDKTMLKENVFTNIDSTIVL